MTSAPFTSGASETDEHPEVAEISALTEGLLSPDRSTDVRAHLAECPLCADVRASLEEIRNSLGTLPGPPAMPADIAGRIDAALAAEALLDSTSHTLSSGKTPASATGIEEGAASGAAAHRGSASESGAGVDERSVSRETEADHGPVSRETADAFRAAGADRPPGRPHAATGPGRGNGSRRPRRLRRTLLATAGLVGVLGIGGILMQTLSGPEQNNAAAKPDEGPLKKQVHSLLDSRASGQSSGAPSIDTKQSPTGSAEKLLRDNATAAVPSCVQQGIDRIRDRGTAAEEVPLATDDKARYKDGSGYLVVLPHPGGGRSQVDVYVVDGSCASRDASDPGKVLLQRTYPRN